MEFNLPEVLDWYKKQGAPADQPALISLLKEIQQSCGGSIPRWAITGTAEAYQIKENYLQAVIRRIPSLRLSDNHCLELCSGPNCAKHRALADFAEELCKKEKITLRFTGCMRLCGKGPNLRWDGTLYHRADQALIQKLINERTK